MSPVGPILLRQSLPSVLRHGSRGRLENLPLLVRIIARCNYHTQPRSFIASATRATATQYAAVLMLMLCFFEAS